MLTPAHTGLTERISTTRSSTGIVLDEAVVEARGRMRDTLSSWCALVAEGRGIPAPAERDVAALAAFLTARLDWLAAHPAAGEFAAEIAELAGDATEALDPRRGRARGLGPCPRPGCTAVVALRPDTGGRVGCGSGHVWQPHEWLSLSSRLARQEYVA
ncbi:hypothetical protein DP939_07585 [Spongiactinospora rosea]|uniref:Uncharacterized protein n=2 Tax=Spongiactinospora rosea TaxID=2248750 RepID=A0A366M4E7_9ACTN|nr:hypothetical protein DP939_07585 [Spongiactinospora rosea]